MKLRINSILLVVAFAGAVCGDVVRFKDGRKLQGEVTDKGDKISLKTRFGTFTFKKSEIAEIDKGKTPLQEYQARLAKLQDDDEQGHYTLAVWCRSRKLGRETRERLTHVLNINPDHSGARRSLGFKKVDGEWKATTTERGESTAKADKTVEVAPEDKPDQPLPEDQKRKAFNLVNSAMAVLKERHYDTALKMLDESLELNPSQPVALYYRGYIYYELRQVKESLRDLDACIELDKEYYFAYFQRAMVHRFAADLGKAITDLDAFLKLQPANSQAKRYKSLFEAVQKGPDWKRTYKRVTRHYDVSTDGSQKLADLTGMELERIYREYSSQFRFKGDELKRKFLVRVFSTREGFLEYMEQTTSLKGDWVAGYYSPTVKELVLYDPGDESRLIDVIYHEGFHQFLDYFISFVPFWYNEGLAEYFEHGEPAGRRFKLGQIDKGRVQMLKRAFASGVHVPIGDLVKLSAREFQDTSPSRLEGVDKVGLHYAESWSFIHFLIHSNKGRYKTVVRDFYLEMKKGTKAEDAFETVFGKANFSKVDRVWQAYVESLEE